MNSSEFLDCELIENPSFTHIRKPNLRDWVLVKDANNAIYYKVTVEKINSDNFHGIIKMIVDNDRCDLNHEFLLGKSIPFTRKEAWVVSCVKKTQLPCIR